MQNNPLRYVMCYVFSQGQSTVIVDPGWPTDASWSALVDGLSEIGVEPEDVDGIVITHGHTDHYGLVGKLQSRSGAWAAIHASDSAIINRMHDNQDTFHQTRRAWLQGLGLDEAGVERAESEASGSVVPDVPVLPDFAPDHHLSSGQLLEVPGYTLRVHWTPGHSPGHICLELVGCDVLISGDHLLPKVTPNISSFSDHGKTALSDYLSSLASTKELDLQYALPAHQWPFSDVSARAKVIEEHHRGRLDEIYDAIVEGIESNVAEIASGISWRRPFEDLSGFQLRAALGETLAHINVLEQWGRVEALGDGTPQAPFRFRVKS